MSLDKYSVDLLNFRHLQTPSLVPSLKTKFPRKFSKSNESHTENLSVIFNTDLGESSLRDLQRESKQSTKNNTQSKFKNAIALTGGIATGKSTAANILRLHGYSVIDADSIAHSMLGQSVDEIVGIFGGEILESSTDSNTPKINRKKLGEIVFNNKVKLQILESILHPKIRDKITLEAQKLEAQNITYFIDIPLFFELQERGVAYEIPRVLLIYAPYEVQLDRIQKRDNLSKESAQMRLSNQIDIEVKRQSANFVIENVGTIRDLQGKIEAFLKHIRNPNV